MARLVRWRLNTRDSRGNLAGRAEDIELARGIWRQGHIDGIALVSHRRCAARGEASVQHNRATITINACRAIINRIDLRLSLQRDLLQINATAIDGSQIHGTADSVHGDIFRGPEIEIGARWNRDSDVL